MSSKRYSSLLLTVMFVGSATAANAGSKSMLDPYAAFQPPEAVKKKTTSAKQQEEATHTSTTYISMPMPQEAKAKKAKVEGAKVQQTPVARKSDSGDGIAATSLNGVKAASSKIVEGSKAMGGGLASGTKKLGGGIATGAKASGGYIMKGAKAIGHGFSVAGDKVKDGAGAAGGKVAGLPKMFGGNKGGAVAKGSDEKARQAAIAQAQAERAKAAAKPADSEWETTTGSELAGDTTQVKSTSTPVTSNHVQPIGTPKTAKSGGIGGIKLGLGKFKMFGGKTQTPVIVAPSTAATPDAIPQ